MARYKLELGDVVRRFQDAYQERFGDLMLVQIEPCPQLSDPTRSYPVSHWLRHLNAIAGQ